MRSWTLLQLADSAFPGGGFAHSGGLEAALAHGDRDVEAFCREAIDATAHGALPLVSAVQVEPERLAAMDALQSAILWSPVAARASRAQGRSLVDVTAAAFDLPLLRETRRAVAAGALAGHLAPMFGLVARALDVPLDEARVLVLHVTLRGILSAAVRLGAAGPREAQALHARLHPALEAAAARAADLCPADVAQTAPLAELFQATHDRLHVRLFQT